MNTPRIDLMKIEDYSDVHALWRSTPEVGLNPYDDSREGIQKYLERNPRTCFVARSDDELIGAILSGHDGRRGYIHHAAVLPSQRKSGVGRALVDQVIEALKQEGIRKVAFVVFEVNEVGNLFWHKLGFEKRHDLIYRNKFIHE